MDEPIQQDKSAFVTAAKMGDKFQAKVKIPENVKVGGVAMDGDNICCFCINIDFGMKFLSIWNIIGALYTIFQVIDAMRFRSHWGGRNSSLTWFYVLNFIRLVPFFMAAYLFCKFMLNDIKRNRERLTVAFFLLIVTGFCSIFLFVFYPGTWLPFDWGYGTSDFWNITFVAANFVIWTFFHLYWMKVSQKYAGMLGIL